MNPYSSFVSFNQFDCFRQCHLRDECKAASFSTETLKSTCLLFKTAEHTVPPTDPNCISYVKKPNSFSEHDLKHFKLKTNLRLGNHFLLTYNTSNALQCFQLCDTTVDCMAASFSYVLFKFGCFLYHDGFTSSVEADWLSYIKIGNNIML